METQGTSEERLLDPAASQVLQDVVGGLRDSLLAQAHKLAADEHVTAENVLAAYDTLHYPSKDTLEFADAQAIISQALRENRVIEWVSYCMAVVLFVFGMVMLSIGAVASDASVRIGCLAAGSIVELLILVPFRFGINSRRHNIALRMLGLIINRVDDPKKLAPLLKDTFSFVVLGAPQFDSAK